MINDTCVVSLVWAYRNSNSLSTTLAESILTITSTIYAWCRAMIIIPLTCANATVDVIDVLQNVHFLRFVLWPLVICFHSVLQTSSFPLTKIQTTVDVICALHIFSFPWQTHPTVDVMTNIFISHDHCWCYWCLTIYNYFDHMRWTSKVLNHNVVILPEGFNPSEGNTRRVDNLAFTSCMKTITFPVCWNIVNTSEFHIMMPSISY